MMTNTKTAAAVNANLKKGNALRLLRANCKHERCIECSDGAKVCITCEKVF